MANEEKFSGRAGVYAKARPQYAKGLMEYLAGRGVGKGAKIADVGSGTGIFSGQLLELGAEVWGVEPNDEMRAEAEKKLGAWDKFHSVVGVAENTGLAEKSVDFVTVAQAFHWFDAEEFKKECKRILKSEGKVILVWNHLKRGTDYEAGVDEVMRKYYPENQESGHGIEHDLTKFFSEFAELKFDNFRQIEPRMMVDKWKSSSASFDKSDARYEGIVKDLEELGKRMNVDGLVTETMETVAYVGGV